MEILLPLNILIKVIVFHPLKSASKYIVENLTEQFILCK